MIQKSCGCQENFLGGWGGRPLLVGVALGKPNSLNSFGKRVAFQSLSLAQQDDNLGATNETDPEASDFERPGYSLVAVVPNTMEASFPT